jgi:protocatechuate 3,4-dioxygenase beta subunit
MSTQLSERRLRRRELAGLAAGGLAAAGVYALTKGNNYSGFGATASNRTFLRGQQKCDDDGVATFRTIYPGWYQGRTTHIVKVHVSGNTVHTGQLFFPDATTAKVNANRQPYAQRGQPDVTNGQDGIYAQGGSASVVRLRRRRRARVCAAR